MVKLYYWLTDSQNVFIWLKSGSRKRHIQSILVKFFKDMASLKIRIEPIWVTRTQDKLVTTDIGSKFQYTDDWGVCDMSFQVLQSLAKTIVTCAVFASSTNKKCRKFYSKVASPGSSGINAFSQSWSLDYNWCC